LLQQEAIVAVVLDTLAASKKMNNDVNISQESFNKDFCLFLEYHLGETFGQSEDKTIKGLWCDGVQMPLITSQISKKSVNDTRRIVTKAWIGYDGQREYEMTIKFGKFSLRRYAKGTCLKDCVPSADTMDWINLDIDKRTIEIQLK
jgi:hypothetical protein